MIIPKGNTRLMGNDIVYFISTKKTLVLSLKAFGKVAQPVKRALIVGGDEKHPYPLVFQILLPGTLYPASSQSGHPCQAFR